MDRIIAIAALCLMAAPLSAAEITVPETVFVEAGSFLHGSDRTEREYAYELDEAAYGHSVTRKQKWYENEAEKEKVDVPAFSISVDLITNADFAAFVAATGYSVPTVDRKTWDSYGLIHPYERTRKFQWPGSKPAPDRLAHPVVLVDHAAAEAYADWLSSETGETWRLPTTLEWEKAARGLKGYLFPWGNIYDPAKLNSHDNGPFDTVPVGQYPAGVSPFGMRDAAGQVFEWTSTAAGENSYVVKGGSWDDKGCGVCRPAAWHTRPFDLKHILVGFRVVREEKN